MALSSLVKDGKTRRFWIEDGLVYTKRRRLYVPLHDNLRKEVLKECHDSRWAGHPGIHRTLALVEDADYWPRMKEKPELKGKCMKQPRGIIKRYARL